MTLVPMANLLRLLRWSMSHSLSTPDSSGPPGHAGIAVGILPHMAAKSVELWRKSKVWVVGRALVIEIHNPTCELDKLSGQVDPWFVVVPLVLGVGRGVRWGAHCKVGVPCEVLQGDSTRALKRLRSGMMSATGHLLIRSLLPRATSTLTEIAYLP